MELGRRHLLNLLSLMRQWIKGLDQLRPSFHDPRGQDTGDRCRSRARLVSSRVKWEGVVDLWVLSSVQIHGTGVIQLLEMRSPKGHCHLPQVRYLKQYRVPNPAKWKDSNSSLFPRLGDLIEVEYSFPHPDSGHGAGTYLSYVPNLALEFSSLDYVRH
ncbi:uncharacterized protein BDZ83DRAFT_654530 [Colletotrichum acutatum]|uniref:Uncharacterized protein n=1 Tax=Glomerella acutata TaxID=27357 RepID=A0AAD8UD24_GLOAC|nr:uncharacterized protein BDZ83DRAFT_654530 [Colletotrichum acutatum]KAK1720230.1 hypothetical protein BDZ83DRAFT_654530 [Colletotrichum acutatum]